MPAQGLSGKQVELLTFYMVSLRRGELPGAYLPKDRVRVSRFSEREFSSDGATVFGAFCSGCHGPEGKGLRAPGMASFPSIANQDVLDLVSDDFLMETVRRGRPGRRMPAWGTSQSGLRPEEIRAAVSHLRQLGGVEHRPDSKPARWVKGDPRVGERLFAASCGGCHGKRGEGGDGPALNNQVLLETATDTFLAETIRRGRRDTDMKGFGEASPVRPTLNQAEIESVVAFLRTWQAAALSSSQQGDKKQ
jgi:cytochrome c oxidase cbb3-type subunit 3